MTARIRPLFTADIATTASVHRVTSILRALLVVPSSVLGVVVHDPDTPDARYPVLVAVFGAWALLSVWWSYRRPIPRWAGPASVLTDLGLLAVMAVSSDGVTSYITPVFYLYPIFTVFYYRPALTAVVGTLIAGSYAVVWHQNLAVNGGPTVTGIVWLHFLLLIWMTLTTTGLALVLARRALADAETRSLQESLTARMIAAEQQHAARLADDLHDGPLQDVIAARRLLESLQPNAADQAQLDAAARLLSTTTQQLRGAVATLHPQVLAQLGLETAILELTRRPGRPLTTVTITALPRLEDDLAYVLYAAARELLANADKHAKATHIILDLVGTTHEVTLTVSDNGCGLTTTNSKTHIEAGHIGLASHALRIRDLGGHLLLENRHPQGTIATITLPLPAPTTTKAADRS
ncbi:MULTISPECIES: ATP-binding protein [unclassified Rathayibacter]|uniref:ATP-binding protein n=1 Tax=unclassified Rathayibacter TaxID=2609250 RepID=UPI00104B9293|nr:MULTISPECIES: ATP-binding protein [unclassified Rathayibacter]TCL79401.1 two-component system NarL family sensor kinase [Rathayibacter sp. PhB192]TCM25331.1 two-component system NarL family sensor kinase [Rathayibacter sp. PhB179]